MRRLPVLAFVLISVFASPLTAQAHPLVGAWDIVLSAGGQGTPYPSSTPPGRTAFLSVTQQGDSLIGQLMLDPMDGQAVPVRMAARIATGDITFENRAPTQPNVGHQGSTVWRWVLNVSGEVLSGTVQRRTEGGATPLPPQPPSQLKGKPMAVVQGTPG